MAFIFGRGAKVARPVPLTGLRIQSSVYGSVIPVIWGTNRIAGNMLWYGDFKSRLVSAQRGQSSGKGGLFGGGGKGQQNQQGYEYSTAMQIALCAGQIAGLLSIWDSQGGVNVNRAQESFVIPSGGGSYTVIHNNGFVDQGVVREDAYSVTANDFSNPSGSVVLGGVQLTPMTIGFGTGQYDADSGVYTFFAGDAGKTVLISYTWTDPNTNNSGIPIAQLGLTLFVGEQGAAPWSYLSSSHPSQAIGYTLLSYVASASANLGSSGMLPNLNFEISGLQVGVGCPGIDALPSNIINDMLTDPHFGCGWLSSEIGDLSAYTNYCQANGLFLSPVVDSPRATAEWLKDILLATNSEVVWSSGQLKVVPYGDTTVVGNGATFVPNTQPIYDLDDTDFLTDKNQDPVKVDRPTIQDAYNSIRVEFANRGNSYAPEIVEAKDQHAIETYGLRPQNPQQMHMVTQQPIAAMIAQTLLSRSVNVRNKYKFRTRFNYILLDPMDVITITDTALRLNKTPVRILTIQEREDNSLEFTAEEFPWGASQPTLYPKQDPAPGAPTANAVPGSVNAPIMFEAMARINGQVGHAIWMGISGASQDWGGCNIWVSSDGETYKQIGSAQFRSRMGVLTGTFASHSDPDTSSTCPIDLTESEGQVLSGTQEDCDNFSTLCFVSAPESQTLVAEDQFDRAVF